MTASTPILVFGPWRRLAFRRIAPSKLLFKTHDKQRHKTNLFEKLYSDFLQRVNAVKMTQIIGTTRNKSKLDCPPKIRAVNWLRFFLNSYNFPDTTLGHT